jgi:hypothetical protein
VRAAVVAANRDHLVGPTVAIGVGERNDAVRAALGHEEHAVR